MKKTKLTFLTLAVFGIAALAIAASTEKTSVQAGPISQKELVQRYGFIDENGDGINDLARDADNDGIPNCMDPDWIRPQDGSGYMNKHGYMHTWKSNWGDGNGTNVCNNTGPHGGLGRNRNSGRSH